MSMEFTSFKFEGVEYPARHLQFDDKGYCVSVESLGEKLMNDKGDYVSREARQFDEQIFFFVEDSLLHKSEKWLVKHIKERL